VPILGSLLEMAAVALICEPAAVACVASVAGLSAGFVAGVTSGSLGQALRAGFIAGVTAGALSAIGQITNPMTAAIPAAADTSDLPANALGYADEAGDHVLRGTVHPRGWPEGFEGSGGGGDVLIGAGAGAGSAIGSAFHYIMETIHAALAAGSFLPSLAGSLFSFLDGTLHLAQGHYGSAAIAIAAAGIGMVADAGAARLALTGAAKLLKPIGSFSVPSGLKFGTTTFGNYAHRETADLLQGLYQGENFVFRILPGQVGVDITVLGDSIKAVGFRFGEIKPLTISGEGSFMRQVQNWNLPAPVQAITYDALGYVYRGFR
jgi:hypothetical protein